jgi:hypothetical protein
MKAKISRLALWWLRCAARNSNYVKHATREFTATGDTESDGPNRWMRDHLQNLLAVFANEGHSGSSAPWAVATFKKLALFEPLGPLTGADSEWVEFAEGKFQNNRCSHVFKENGEAYDSEGRIFQDPDGCCYQNFESRVPVTFPYTPKREYVLRQP